MTPVHWRGIHLRPWGAGHGSRDPRRSETPQFMAHWEFRLQRTPPAGAPPPSHGPAGTGNCISLAVPKAPAWRGTTACGGTIRRRGTGLGSRDQTQPTRREPTELSGLLTQPTPPGHALVPARGPERVAACISSVAQHTQLGPRRESWTIFGGMTWQRETGLGSKGQTNPVSPGFTARWERQIPRTPPVRAVLPYRGPG